MKQIILSVNENKFNTFIDFVKTLNYVKIIEPEEVALEELQHSLTQVKLMQIGKLPKKTADEFLNEFSS
jgi:hypothetical protein